ncbi:MAG: LEPR-XLL domain-containing protein [Verrucomicrobia bacterium]|nr:LEPR-XLL domain-containing protein [Verrucomicrobiota bacterium]
MLEPRLLLSAEPLGLAAGLVGVLDNEWEETEPSFVTDEIVAIRMSEAKGESFAEIDELSEATYGWAQEELFASSPEDSATNPGVELTTGFASWLSGLKDLTELFDLNTLDMPILPDNLAALFGISNIVAAASAPDFSGFSELSDLVHALVANGFEVISVEGGLIVGEDTIAPSTGDTIIEVQWTVNFASGIEVVPNYDTSLLHITNDLTPGLTNGLSLEPAFSWSGDLEFSFLFGLDDAGFFIDGSSNVRLGITGNGDISGNADIGAESDVSLTGTVALDQWVGLYFSESGERYRMDQFADGYSSLIMPLAGGVGQFTLSGITGPVDFDFSFTATLNSDLGQRTIDSEIVTALSGTVGLAGIQDDSGDPAKLAFNGSYNSAEDHWLLTIEVAGDLQIAGQKLSNLQIDLILAVGSLSGTGSAGLALAFFQSGNEPMAASLSFEFDTQGFEISGVVTGEQVTFGDTDGMVLFSGTGFNATVAASSAYDGAGLSGGMNVTFASAEFAPNATAFEAIITDSDSDGVALSGTFDFASEVVLLQIDSLLFTATGLLHITAAGATFRYDRRNDAPDQEYFRLENLDVELIALRNQSATDPPSVKVSEFVVRKDGISIESATATLGDIEIAGIVGLSGAKVGFENVVIQYAGSAAGSISLQAQAGFFVSRGKLCQWAGVACQWR